MKRIHNHLSSSYSQLRPIKNKRATTDMRLLAMRHAVIYLLVQTQMIAADDNSYIW